MKKIFSMLLCFVLTASAFTSVKADNNNVTVIFDDKEITFPDAQPFIDSRSRTLVPIRFVSEAMGAQVEWDNETKTAIIRKENDVIKYTIGNAKGFINDEMVVFDTYGILKENRTFVPIRYISELLHCDVDWIDTERLVKITSPGIAEKFPDPEIKVNYPESEWDKRLFWITLENHNDFQRECPNYEYRIEFLTPTHFNEFEQNEGAILGWQKYIRGDFVGLTLSNNTIVSVGRAYYSTRANMKRFKPTEGMEISFKLTVFRKCSNEKKEYVFTEKLQLPYPLIEWEE